MELEKENIHQLAVHYFEGRITLQEEEELFRFVNACTDNYEMFRRWEKEWMQSATPDLGVISEWKHYNGVFRYNAICRICSDIRNIACVR